MDTKKVHRSPAEGSPRGKPYDLSHSPSGRLIAKYRDNHSVTLSDTVGMYYGYCNEYQPHAVRHIFDEENKTHCDLRWDPAGNLGQISVSLKDNVFDHGRFLFWTEDCCGPRPCGANRMHAAVDDRYYSYYAYDHSGGSCASREQSQACLSYAEMEQRRRSQRRLKLTGDNKLLDVNADFMATYAILNEPTLYPSAYMVLTNKGYTKHYYAGTERVAARLGGGGLNAQYHVIGNDVELQTKADILFKQSIEQMNSRVLNENNLDCIMQNEFAKEEFGYWIDGIPYQMKADVEIDHGQFKDMVNSMLTDYHNGEENEVYFYHSDHLGSASWITDFSGMAAQHLQYLPYGEPYINQRPFGYSERFTFTGKERDEETGFGYFGARYMDHELMTMWLSVDPMADKYPNITPYAYCAWNPVRLVDPDGRDWYESEDGKTLAYYHGETGEKEGFTHIGAELGKEYMDKLNNGDYSNLYMTSNFQSSEFVSQYDNKHNKIMECATAAKKMRSKRGGSTPTSYANELVTVTNDGNGRAKSGIKNNLFDGIYATCEQLAKGIPVIAGMDYKNGTSNPGGDGITDHYVVITSISLNLAMDNRKLTITGGYLGYTNPGSSTASQGMSSNNRFTINPSNWIASNTNNRHLSNLRVLGL